MAEVILLTATRRGRGVVAFGIGGAILAASRMPGDGDTGVPLCLFRWVTGLPCPSCGMTRAFHAIAHGDLSAALHLNLASPLVFAGTATIALLGAAQALGGPDILSVTWRNTKLAIVPLTLAAMVAAWTANLAGSFGR